MPGTKTHGPAPQGTVYGELKLSEKLSEELNIVKSLVDKYKEDLEEANYYRDLYKNQVEELANQLQNLQREVKLYKTELIELREKSKVDMIRSQHIMKASKGLTQFVMISEQYRKKFSEELRKALSQNDEQSNKVFELEQNRRLHEISYELVQGKLSMLFNSINAISNAKKLEDKFQFEINELNNVISQNKQEKSDVD
jgi:hypothetical protein